MKKTTLLLILLCLSLSISAQTYLTENFDAVIPATWTIDDAGAATGDSWISGQQGGGNSLDGTNVAIADSDANGNGTLLIETLTSPAFDTTGATAIFLDFDQFYNNIGTDTAVVEVWDGATWIPVLTQTADIGAFNAPDEQHINITAYSNAAMQVRFVYNDDNSWAWYWLIDNVAIYNATCPNPDNLTFISSTATTANLSWTAGGTETDWEIVVQPQGTGLPTGSGTATTTNNPHVEMGLTPATSYEAYIRSDCGADFSIWIGPINFVTECVTFVAPYTEGFENGGTIPLCWTMNGGEDWDFNLAGPNHVGNAGTITGTTATNMYYAVVDASGNDGPSTLITPLVDVSTLTTPALSFFEISDNEGNANSQLDVEVWDGAAWNPMGTYNTNTAGWELKIIDISTLTITGDVQARFIFSEIVTGDFYDDIAIDDVTFDELPSCVIPGGIVANNITGASADITWMAGGGETAWEYVIQAAGTGVPTGAGTATTTTGFNATGLSFETDYEIYVLSDCGVNGFSAWAGPVNFTTTVQLNFTVDCAVGPENITYCYNTGDTNVFTFTSTDGSPLNFIINSGNVENNFDELVVFDTDGVTDLNVATPYGNAGDVSGITYQSTGDTISFQVTPDGSVDCQGSANINPLDITVSCATCINPIATYEIVDDCANGNQFLVDVNITSLGDATSLAIQDNQGNPTVSVSATGITQFGPYPFNIDVIFTVSNEQDVNCVITSSAFQLAACPPANDNCGNATVAVVNDSFLCEMTTSGTLIEATPSGVPDPSCGGDPDDDVWFEFVATSEFQLIALTNIQGSETNNIGHAVYEGVCGTLTEISCTTGFGNLSSVTAQLVIGDTYFIRIFSNNSNAETTTFDLCITPYVAPTNITCDASENLCPGAGDLYTYNTINVRPGLGQIDCLGSSPDPTFSIIEIGTSGDINIEMVQNTAFDGMGNPIGDELDVDFALWGPFNAGDDYCNGGDYPSTPVVGCSYSAAPIENFVITAAIAGDIYIVLITNFAGDPGIIQINQTNFDPTNPDPNAGTLSAEINVELISPDTGFIDDDNDVTTPSVANLCGFNSITLEADSPFADTYEWYVNGILDPSLTSSSITVTESNSYSVTAYDTQCMGNDTTTVIVNLYKEAIVSIVPPDEVSITTCDDESGDGIEEFDLSGLSSIILNAPGQNPADFLLTYHATLNDAQTGTNALTSPYSATDATTIYVRVEDLDSVGSGSGCASTNTTFLLTVLGALPEIIGVGDLELCDDNNDGIQSFNLELNTPVILNGQDPAVFEVSYHISQTDADTGMNTLVSPYNNISNPQTIYARIQNSAAFDCYKTTTFNIQLAAKPILVQADSILSCDDGIDGIANFDLTLNESVIVNNQPGFVFSYYNAFADAETSMNAIVNPTSFDGMAQTIYVRVEDVNGCFDVTTFEIALAPKPILVQADSILSCDDGIDGIANFDLTLNDSVIVNSQPGFVFSYYNTFADAEISMNAIVNPTSFDGIAQTIFVRVEDVNGCFDVTTFEIALAPKPILVQADSILGCDDDQDGIANYDLTTNEAVIVNNQTGFIFSYYNTFADAEISINAIANPTDFDGGVQTIVVRVEDIDGCFDVTSFDLTFGISPITSFDSSIVYEVCPNATVPIIVEATGDNYTESAVTITWYNEGVLVPGQTDLTIDNVLTTGTYTIEVMFNDTGCTSSEDIFVEELETCVIPQGISPNGDGLNDTFDLSSYDVQSLTIFNRYGIKVYEKTTYLDEWHGQSLDGDELPVGTYYYVMNYQGNKTKAAWVYINRENK